MSPWLLVIYFCLSRVPFSLQDICTYCKCVHGQYADEPIWIDVGKKNEIAVLGHSCGRPVVYTWKAVTGTGATLVDFGETNVPRVIWMPFVVSVRPDTKGTNNRIIVTKSDGRTTGRCECHIDFVNLDIYSHIDGADLISIGREQVVELDGSHSYDFSQPKDKQRYTFEWRCTPIEKDLNSQYCQNTSIMCSTPKCSIDGHYLAVTGLYKITLHTTSLVTGAIAGDHLYLRVEYGTKIPLLLLCAHNCWDYFYNDDSSISIDVECIGYCGDSLKFYFAVDDKFITTNSNGKVRFMPPKAATFKFNVTLIADGVDSEAIATFKRNDPPTGGSCTITPQQGIPGDTLFKAACSSWTDRNLPIYYVLKAGNLLYDRTTDPHWEIYVPQVKALSFRICDSLDACQKYEVPIELVKPDIPKGLKEIQAYMQEPANNVERLLEGGEYARAVVKATLMMAEQPLDVIKHVLSAFKNFKAESLTDVRQLGTMTSELVDPMGNLTSEKVNVFNELLDKMSEGFDKVIANGDIKDMHKEDVRDMTEELVGMMSKFSNKSERFVDVQSLLWEFEGGMLRVADERAPLAPKHAQLIEYYGAHTKLNDTVLAAINIWMHAICRSFELLRDMGVASSHNVHKGDHGLVVDKLTVQMIAFGIDETEALTVVSLDYFTTAVLTKPMLQDMQAKLGGTEMTAQMISFKENPFWWYPTEHPITTTVFYFSAFSEANPTISGIELKVPFKFEMLQQRTLKEPALLRGYVEAAEEMPIYQIRAPQGAAVIINIVKVELDMDVLVKCNKMPNLKAVRVEGKQVKLHKTSKDIIQNGTKYADSNCADKAGWCYLALIAAKGVQVRRRAHYAFTVELYECLSWNVNLDNPTWQSKGCIAAIDPEGGDNITCLCHHMSIFAGSSYYSTAEELVRDRILKQHLDVNWYVVAFYILLLLVFLWLLLRTCDDLTTNHAKLVAELSENEQIVMRNIALHITTGGQWTAASSAKILITLPSGQTFTVTQDPEHPFLRPHTTCVLELPIHASKLNGLQISQDKSGRYPSWYCESITIVNLTTGQKQHCTVRKWIGRTPVSVQPDKLAEDAAGKEETTSKKLSGAQKWKKFRAAYYDVFMAWFLFQPLFGSWHCGMIETNRFVRSCILISKFAVIVLLVFLYFGETNLDNYEADRYNFQALIRLIDGWFVLYLCGCYFITLALELLLLLFVYPDFWKGFKRSAAGTDSNSNMKVNPSSNESYAGNKPNDRSWEGPRNFSTDTNLESERGFMMY
ncbi:uncharacterized protein LOC105227850 [Bactrocera dorsalis]|uniref:Uncharacterized protein LOC105227850 n=1 Tax=Bactrocera dorsalis TaxID=27457 RepID=A0A6I9V2Z5_BACDO|nr:uncharacterized protein LOC105227850 [Bactrocera dorsalis]